LRRDGKESVGAILVNLFLSDGRGVETFDRLFQAAPDIPLLVLSSLEHENTAKLAVQRGAQDYILEDHLDSYLLPKALRNMLERASNAEALFREKERAQVTLNSIGDAVVCTEVSGTVTFLNPIAEALTGWRADEAIGRPFVQVFRIIDGLDHRHAIDPMALVIETNKTVNLPQGSILIRRDGTETAFMQDPQSAIAVLRALKDMGIQLTLDDFGTGYSSLSYLKRFPIKALKIDKSFVQGIGIDSDNSKLVTAVINLGRSFHLQVIAEGVETREQFLALQAQQCAEGQGYYFQKPIAANEFAKLLGADLSTTLVV
jgi:PAS domain S-box-containing protein